MSCCSGCHVFLLPLLLIWAGLPTRGLGQESDRPLGLFRALPQGRGQPPQNSLSGTWGVSLNILGPTNH